MLRAHAAKRLRLPLWALFRCSLQTVPMTATMCCAVWKRSLTALLSCWSGFASVSKRVKIVLMANATSLSLPTCFKQTEPLSDNLRFIAVDVETSGYDIASICQIGLAFVGFDSAIATYSAYIDPCTPFAAGNSRLHGIDAATVKNAPKLQKYCQTCVRFLKHIRLFNIAVSMRKPLMQRADLQDFKC